MGRPKVVAVGLGPAAASLMTDSARRRLEAAPCSVLRTTQHPAADAFPGLPSFDEIYETSSSFAAVYDQIVSSLVELARSHGEVVYAVPGSPLVAERTVELLRSLDEIELEVIPALSFVDLAWAALGIDPLSTGVRLVDATDLGDRLRGPAPILVAQCHSPLVLSELKLSIDADLIEPRPRCVVLHHLGLDDQQIVELDVDALDRFADADHLTSVYIPSLRTVGEAAEDLVELMATLRARCPWDQKQTHGSLGRHLLEEAYESLEAIEHLAELLDQEPGTPVEDAYAHVAEELGDLVFQVVFHAHLAAEEGQFDLTEVLDGVRRKLIGRHPHVFGDAAASTADEVASRWEDIKRAEKGRSSVTEGIPVALPSLARYTKLRRKAAAIGMSPPSGDEARSALLDALHDLGSGEAVAIDDADATAHGAAADDIASMLAAVAELAQMAGVDPEEALRRRADALRDEIIEDERLRS